MLQNSFVYKWHLCWSLDTEYKRYKDNLRNKREAKLGVHKRMTLVQRRKNAPVSLLKVEMFASCIVGEIGITDILIKFPVTDPNKGLLLFTPTVENSLF